MIEPVSDSERITRFIVERSKFSPSTGRIKHNAFVPPNNRRLSVYRTEGLPNPEVWAIGNDFVAPALGKPILARGDLQAAEFFKWNLRIEPDPTPHNRHCNVINWPESEWLQVAIELAN